MVPQTQGVVCWTVYRSRGVGFHWILDTVGLIGSEEKSWWGIEGARQWNYPVWETLVMLFHEPPLSSGGDFCKHHRVPRGWTEACEWWEYHPPYTSLSSSSRKEACIGEKNKLLDRYCYRLICNLLSSQNWLHRYFSWFKKWGNAQWKLNNCDFLLKMQLYNKYK